MSVTAGSDHTCALAESGEAYCWGGRSASLASSYISRPQPTAVKGGLQFVALSRSSGDDTCGIIATGAAYCWDAALEPVAVPGGPSFASLASADNTTCGLDAGQTAYCWGDNNSLGQLGNGSFVPDGSAAPAPVSGAVKFTQIGTSSFGNSCGLADGGAAYCWGQNGWGQLGDGTETKRAVPVAVTGGLSFVEITTGWVHTCGLTSAGSAYCWGAGQLIDGTTRHILSPVAVAGGLTFRTISAGASQTCGLTLDGSAHCWGNHPGLAQAGVPTPVPGGLSFTSLTTGGSHACGLDGDGKVYCWGRNSVGQIGDGTTADQVTPVLVRRQ